ncbi:ribosomal-protein-alanine acetyltransferase [Mycoplasma sp. CAG:776]|nr:ribosomal-protein-alanine acetyltransferase [Mycoplasma sp. CAG:776]
MIREADVYDIPRINELGGLLEENFSKVYSINEMLEDGISKVFVYEKDDQVVGFLTATYLYETCDILSLVVDPLYRKQMIASNLLDYLISDMDENLKVITLEVATKNIPALNLYEKFGFEVIHVRKNYYKDDDAYLMSRKSE